MILSQLRLLLNHFWLVPRDHSLWCIQTLLSLRNRCNALSFLTWLSLILLWLILDESIVAVIIVLCWQRCFTLWFDDQRRRLTCLPGLFSDWRIGLLFNRLDLRGLSLLLARLLGYLIIPCVFLLGCSEITLLLRLEVIVVVGRG